MKKPVLICLLVFAALFASAQKTYFLYLQTEDLSPFYVRMADKIFSSSTSGYLIVPNLTDTTYVFGVGFPKSTQPETRFAVTMSQNDKGYLLKNFSDGLSLFDIEELSIVKSISANKDNTVYETKTDKFSSILSKAADDPSLLKVAKKEEPKPEPEKKEPVVAKKEEPKPEPKEPVVTKSEEAKPTGENTKEAATTQKTSTEIVPEKKEAIKTEAALGSSVKPKVEEKQSTKEESQQSTIQPAYFKPSTIVRRSESSTTEGFGIVYIDRLDDRIDTVRILIPPSKITLEQTTQNTSVQEAGPETTPPSSTASKGETKQSASESGSGVATTQSANQMTNEKPVKQNATSGCKELASDKDFIKLRKNMAAKSSDDDMIFEARKAFKLRCYTSEQVRYLSTLFLNAGAKYQFFDTAYNYVADKENFAALQSEIKDEYFLKRFKALVGE